MYFRNSTILLATDISSRYWVLRFLERGTRDDRPFSDGAKDNQDESAFR
jgi:hypothetical protein